MVHKVSNQTFEHDPCSIIQFFHEVCHILHRLLHTHVDMQLVRIVATPERRSCRTLGASAGSTHAPSLLELPLTSRSRRPDSSLDARFLGAADLLQFRSGSEIEILMTILSSPQESFFWTINPHPRFSQRQMQRKKLNPTLLRANDFEINPPLKATERVPFPIELQPPHGVPEWPKQTLGHIMWHLDCLPQQVVWTKPTTPSWK